MAKERNIYGYKVSYEESAEKGADYLKDDLSRDEAEVFFMHAKREGEAQFEDDNDRNFTLLYKDNSYVLLRRD